ncbi:MAG: hypothetical protein EBS34_12935 [Flavobacteriales bacterium]|nr:hypothetical protein [Flavobacteriales bacterium]
MNQYIKTFDPIHESIKQHGIILIKGKPKGKDKEPSLFATHVNTWAEFRPGAVMMFLSDTFYRIIKDGDALKGIKINWRDEDSLKDSLNFKAPGKLSIFRNNNKTPYHWKTLKHTNLRDALDSVTSDLLGSNYLLESVDSLKSLEKTVLSDAIDSIFMEGEKVIVLDWEIPYDVTDSIDSEERQGSQDIEWEVSFDCLYVGRPELDDKLSDMELRRFEITIYFESNVSFSQWYSPGDYMNPPDGGIEIESVDTKVTSITLDGSDFEDSFGVTDIVSEMEDSDLSSFIGKKHSKFI